MNDSKERAAATIRVIRRNRLDNHPFARSVIVPLDEVMVREIQRYGKRFVYLAEVPARRPERIVFYDAARRKAIGEASVARQFDGTALTLWRGTARSSAMSKDAFASAFGGGESRMTALKISDPVMYKPSQIEAISIMPKRPAMFPGEHRFIEVDDEAPPPSGPGPKRPRVIKLDPKRARYAIVVDGFHPFGNLRDAAGFIGCSKSLLHSTIAIGGHCVHGHHISYENRSGNEIAA